MEIRSFFFCITGNSIEIDHCIVIILFLKAYDVCRKPILWIRREIWDKNSENGMAEARYLISDAAKKVDVESHVLRYWEEELELNIPRNEMGHRYYTDYHIRLFRQVKELKEKVNEGDQGVLDRLNGVSGEITITEEDMEREMRKTWLAERWPAPDMEGEQMKREKRIVVDGGRGKQSVEEAAMQTPSQNRLRRQEREKIQKSYRESYRKSYRKSCRRKYRR